MLPELTPGGYDLTEAIWDSAECMSGPSVEWLKSTAARHGIHLGMSFLEADGQDFFNSFVLATPQGKIAGRVRKNPPASAEAYFFRAGGDAHFIDTDIGRLGVSICYEALLYERLNEHFVNRVDLLLMPLSAGTPTPTFPLRKREGAAFEENIRALPLARSRSTRPSRHAGCHLLMGVGRCWCPGSASSIPWLRSSVPGLMPATGGGFARPKQSPCLRSSVSESRPVLRMNQFRE